MMNIFQPERQFVLHSGEYVLENIIIIENYMHNIGNGFGYNSGFGTLYSNSSGNSFTNNFDNVVFGWHSLNDSGADYLRPPAYKYDMFVSFVDIRFTLRYPDHS